MYSLGHCSTPAPDYISFISGGFNCPLRVSTAWQSSSPRRGITFSSKSVLHSEHHHRGTWAFVVTLNQKQFEHHHNHSSQRKRGMTWVWQDPLRILALVKVIYKVTFRHFTVEEIWKFSHNCISKKVLIFKLAPVPQMLCFISVRTIKKYAGQAPFLLKQEVYYLSLIWL